MITQPYPFFTDTDGNPLEGGKLFFGEYGLNPETDPVQMYWDSAQTQPAAQPIRTVAGVPSRNGKPSSVYGPSQYSLTVRTKNDQIISSTLNLTEGIDYGTY